jgi:ankyrin repeat protein
MMMNFKTLCETLELPSACTDEKTLHTIAKWCDDNVSQDLRFEKGTVSERYNNYLELARIYLDEILPRIPSELGAGVPAFDGRNAVQEAAFSGLDRMLSSLRPTGDVLNTPNQDTMTPLHGAAIMGHFHTLSELLSLGANPSIANQYKQLPIFSSLGLPVLHEGDLKENKMKIFRLLKEKAPESVKLQDDNGDTVLHEMAAHGFSALITELLQTNPELAEIKNYHTHYPVHTAILNGQTDGVRLLLQQKGGETLADSHGWVALHYAARAGGKDIMTLCCDATPDLNCRDESGRTPLMLAAEVANIAAMAELIQRGARVDLSDAAGYTVLHHAAKGGNLRAVSWLLDNITVDINAQANRHQTALSISQEHGNDEIRNLLLAKGATPDRRFVL